MSVQNQTPDWREALLTFWNKPLLKNIRFIFNIAYSVLKNIFVIAILPPFADAVNKKMKEIGKYHYQEVIYPTLKPIFDSYGFELWEGSHLSTYNSNDKEAIDGFHGGEVSYLRLLIYILEKGSVLNNVTDILKLKDDLNNRKNSLSVY